MYICDKGIYETEKAYHDDLDYTWYVRFDDPKEKQDADFRRLVDIIEARGADKKMGQLRSILGVKNYHY